MNDDYKVIKEFVLCELNEDYSGHDYLHALRVYKNAKKILTSVVANQKIVLTSALIHDLVDYKLFNDLDKQVNLIKNFLLNNSYSIGEVQEIIDIITNISFSKKISLHTIEAQIVSDSDKLDASGAIGIIRTIEYGCTHKRKFYDEHSLENVILNKQEDNENVTLAHFYQKLLLLDKYMYTDIAKEICLKRTKFLEIFLKEFFEEIND